MDWKKEIAVMALVKSELAKADTGKLWPYHLPRVAATQAQISAAESCLGHKLDEEYAQFLRHANGWPAFYQSVQLFGTEELLGNAAMENALRTVSYLEENVLKTSGVDRAALLPIAATDVDMDLFVIDRTGSPARARVIWFAGTEVQRFDSFNEYFLAMVDYNRAELAALKK
jgi:hypothetical protein